MGLEFIKGKIAVAAITCIKALSVGYISLSDLPKNSKNYENVVNAVFQMGKALPMPALLGQQLGIGPESVFISREKEPKSSLVKVLTLHWVAGEPNLNLTRKLIDLTESTDTIIYPPSWKKMIISELESSNTPFQILERHAVNFEGLDPDHLQKVISELPSGYELRPIDVDLANELNGSSYFQSGWHVTPFITTENFLDKGFGYVLFHGEKMVGAASTAAVFGNEIEIQIDIIEEYRRKGLAKYVSAKLVQESLNRGLNPHWDAVSIPSKKIALALGYTESSAYEVIYINHPPKQ